jgi:seryl-tRNA synthetase
MLDINLIRTNPDEVRTGVEKKGVDSKLVDKISRADEDWREKVASLETMKAEQNLLSKDLAKEQTEDLIAKASVLKKRVAEMQEEVNALKIKRDEFLARLPNLPLADVPVGKNEDDNVVSKTVGKPEVFNFKPKNHMEIGEALGVIDTEVASKVSGSRFNYLKGDAVLLEFSLVQYVFHTLQNEKILKKIAESVGVEYSAKPFIPVVPPIMIRPEVYQRMARLEPKEERYYIPSDDIYLIGSAEHTLGPIHMDETIPETSLPLRYVGFSVALRREAGAAGKDTHGILRVHQFDKIEMESFTTPENGRAEQDFIVGIQEYLLHSLGLPYQVISVCTGDMGSPDARQIDINTWMPGQETYRETHTSDYNGDYQSRRLGTKVKRKDGSKEFLHMNDATAFAIGRTIIAILENYQNADGSVTIPEVLRPYMMGKEKITKG